MSLIRLIVNGDPYELIVPSKSTLLEVIRDQLHLTGTKEGCGTGDCGACTVLVENKPVNSCLVLAVEMDGKEILTIEGLAENGKLHPLQEAFIEHGAVQCGFCTSGMSSRDKEGRVKLNMQIKAEQIPSGFLDGSVWKKFYVEEVKGPDRKFWDY